MALQGINDATARLLERMQALPQGTVDRLRELAQTREQWLGRVAVDHQLLTDDELARYLSQGCDVPLLALRQSVMDPSALACLSEEACRHALLVPLSLHDDLLRVAVANPLPEALAMVREWLPHLDIRPSVATISEIEFTIRAWYHPQHHEKDGHGRRHGRHALLRTAEMQQVADALAGEDERLNLLREILLAMIEHNGSDLHLSAGMRPLMRLSDGLQAMPTGILTERQVTELVYAIMTPEQRAEFEAEWELDFALSIPGISRFRVNVFRQSGTVSAVFRAITLEVPTLHRLGMPPVLRELALRPRGLVLVTGPTGSGKSTTLAAMVDEINRHRRCHIVTIEDPVEYVHTHKRCEISQRQVGSDTKSFAIALRHVMRQDPDVILVGEMRDLETISAAITAAETGHLVLSTLHTIGAAETIDRIIDVFPPHQQEQIRVQVATVLEGVISQLLLPSVDATRRICAQEIMTVNTPIRTLIRDAKTHQIGGIIQTGARTGMQTMTQCLQRLVQERKITRETAQLAMAEPEE